MCLGEPQLYSVTLNYYYYYYYYYYYLNNVSN